MVKIVCSDMKPPISQWDALNSMLSLNIEAMYLFYKEESIEDYKKSSFQPLTIKDLEESKGELITPTSCRDAIKLDKEGIIQRWAIWDFFVPTIKEDGNGFDKVHFPSFHYFPGLMQLLEQCEVSHIQEKNKVEEVHFWIQNISRGEKVDDLDRGIYISECELIGSANPRLIDLDSPRYMRVDLNYFPGVNQFLNYLIKKDCNPAYSRWNIMEEGYSEETTNAHWLAWGGGKYLDVYFPIMFPFKKHGEETELNTSIIKMEEVKRLHKEIITRQTDLVGRIL